MKNFEATFLDFVIANYGKEELLIKIFDFLRTQIPFELLACYHQDRQKKMITSFIEYRLDNKTSSNFYKFNPIIANTSFIRENIEFLQKVHITTRDQLAKLTIFESFPHPINSLLSFLFNIEEDTYSFFSVACLSSKENCFSSEHIKILEAAQPYLEKIIYEHYLHYPEKQIYMASIGILPNSYEEQLRACPNMNKVLRSIEIVAPLETSILIHGATGTGKELVASTIHVLSERANKPYVIVNCAAIPESLLESALFGHERGAFTGAIQTHKGYFEQANDGTIFLDEVGELSLAAQASLLRVIEAKQIQRVGGKNFYNVNNRIITATHRDLKKMVYEGTFREDLYYRLKGFTISVPSLAERKLDLRILANHFYTECKKKFKNRLPRLSENAIQDLYEYDWPGNVRQLKAMLEEAIINALAENKEELDFKQLFEGSTNTLKRKPLSYDEIAEALLASQGKIQGKNGAAELLGVKPTTLRSRMSFLNMVNTAK